MGDESERHSRRAIRQLLLAAFNAEELHDIFYFSRIPELQAVPDQFAPGDSYPTKVRKAVRYCDSRFLLGELLAEVKEANPRAYEKYEATLHTPGGTKIEPERARPRWLVPALAATLVVVLISLAVVLVLLLREPAGPPEPTATERAQATLSPEPMQTDSRTATSAPEPTAVAKPTSTKEPTPPPTPTVLPAPERQFVVVYPGHDGVTIRSGPGTNYPEVGVVYAGELLVVDGVPEIRADNTRWWPVHTELQRGWVIEWTGDTRLVKPYMQAGDDVVVANLASTGNVWLRDKSCNKVLVLNRGTALTLIDGPDPTECDEVGDTISHKGREWWYVETPEGQPGWMPDFSSQSWGDWVKYVLVAPQWYVDLSIR